MKSGKRVLAGILAFVMALSLAQFPAGISHAEELALPVQESVQTEEGVREESGQLSEEQESGEETPKSEEQLPGNEEKQEGEIPSQNGTVQEETAPGEENPVEQEIPEEQEKEEPVEKLPADGEDTVEENTGDEDTGVNAETPAQSVQISGNDLRAPENDLQVSGNDLMTAEDQEVWVEAEIEGAYQFGGAPSAGDGIAVYAGSVYTDEEMMDDLYEQMKARSVTIDVSKYDIPYEEQTVENPMTPIRRAVSGVLNEHPDLYFVDQAFGYSHNGTMITSITLTYHTYPQEDKVQEGISTALAAVDADMSDLEKAVVLHDYLVVNCEYDQENLMNGSVPSESHSIYGVFANRTAVCDGYALAYKHLLRQVGIDCYMVTSEEINHAWNLIVLDGKYYQVDVTWDDPVWDKVGRAVHTYMFRSDAGFDPANAQKKHSGGQVTYGSTVVDYRADDTRYDNAFWTDCTSPLVLDGDDCYYVTSSGTLNRTVLSDINGSGTVVQNIGKWFNWVGSFSGLFKTNNRLYFNDTMKIYSVAMDGTDKKAEFNADVTKGYIYGSAYCQGKVLYALHMSPNLTEKEEVLEADLEIGGGSTEPDPPSEGDQALNLKNLDQQYTALDGTTIYSAAEGRPKLLIFYSNGCGNSRSAIKGISGRIHDFDGTDIYAIEVNKNTKEDVAAFRTQYGCGEIVFSYDTLSGNVNDMWDYVDAAGVPNAQITWPVICYIDADNRLQFVTTGYITAGAVLSHLKEYCNLSQGGETGGLPEIGITPAEGNLVVGFSGAYYTESAEKILGRINEIRLEACKEGVLNPSTEQPLTEADYVPIKWSSDLEAIARLRAAEAKVNEAHTRPNGERCFTIVTSNGERSWAENLAWNYTGLMYGIEQWYSEKEAWVNQDSTTVTGHYTSMINPGYQYVGVGAFRLASGGWYSVAQEFSSQDALEETKNSGTGECVQNIEVQGSKVSALTFDKNLVSAIQEGGSCQLPLQVTVNYGEDISGTYQAGGEWSSSDETVAAVDRTGLVTARGKGTAKISVQVGTQSASVDIHVYGSGEFPVTIERPAVTTYKVGAKIDTTGGKVTYSDNGTVKTVDMKPEMISGFDSAKPGICTVQVVYNGYTAGFDTLIVEEPKLTADYGQTLKNVLLPRNDYGTYSWQDNTQILDQMGTHTFSARFTPKDTERFQELTDLQISVTVQRTPGDSLSIAFKNTEFIYNGEEQRPKVVVSVADPASPGGKNTVLEEGRDYELSYADNRNAGEATVTVTGTSAYLFSVSKTFTIQPAKLTVRTKDKTVLIGGRLPGSGDYEYTVSGLQGKDSLLRKPVLSCAVADTKTPGRYPIIAEGADAGTNYILSYEYGTLTVAEEENSCSVVFDVQGHGMAPAEQVGLKIGGMVKKPEDPAAQGYCFKGWYRDPACTKAWDFDTDIVQENMILYAKWVEESKGSSFAFQEIADVPYTGKQCKPAVSVYDGEVLLKAGRDYQIRYYNNTDANTNAEGEGNPKRGNGAGSYFNPDLPYVEITGKGNYKDQVKVNFNILKAVIGYDGRPAGQTVLKVKDQLVVSGKAQKPFSSVRLLKNMKPGKDFTLLLTAENAFDSEGSSVARGTEMKDGQVPAGSRGEFSLTVTGTGNYEGSIRKKVYVADQAHLLKNATVTIGRNVKNSPFQGEPVELTPAMENSPDVFTVKCGGVFLEPGQDYTVEYRSNDRVGKAELTVVGKGEYYGTKTAGFLVKGKTFSGKTVHVDGIENREYTGRALTQNTTSILTYSDQEETGKRLVYGRDYTISYSKNVNRGSAVMTFRGREEAGYSGSFKKTFQITPVDIGDPSKVTRSGQMKNMAFAYCKAGVKPEEEIRLTNREGMVLQRGRDYTLKYLNNKAVADASSEKAPTVIVKGKGNYAGEFAVPFRITKADLDGLPVEATAVAFQPNKGDAYTYQPAVKLMDGKTALRAGKDYEIQYFNNTQAECKAYLEAAAQGRVPAGEVPHAVISEKPDACYTLKKPITVSLPVYRTKLVKRDVEITVNREEAVYTGDRVEPAVSVKYGGKLLREDKDYEASYGANNRAGKNRGSVTIEGIDPEYGGSVTVKFDIQSKNIMY